MRTAWAKKNDRNLGTPSQSQYKPSRQELDWDVRVLPKCADNIVAEAHGADLAMHF